jgi:hypothetical protein
MRNKAKRAWGGTQLLGLACARPRVQALAVPKKEKIVYKDRIVYNNW